MKFVLTGGEDHALVATFPADVPLPDGWTVIGSVLQGTGVTVDGEAYSGAGGPDTSEPRPCTGPGAQKRRPVRRDEGRCCEGLSG